MKNSLFTFTCYSEIRRFSGIFYEFQTPSVKLQVFACMPNHAQLFKTPQTVDCQASLSMGFSRQEYWSGLLFPSPGDLPDPEINPISPALAGEFFTTDPPGKPTIYVGVLYCTSGPLRLLFPLPRKLLRNSQGLLLLAKHHF